MNEAVGGASEEPVKVLFIEDDPVVADMYRLKLELDGYSVKMASDGVEGLRLAEEGDFDLIFLDLRLPQMNGFEVLQNLSASNRGDRCPVIILSNYDEEELIERGIALGAVHYLIKSQVTPSGLSAQAGAWRRMSA